MRGQRVLVMFSFVVTSVWATSYISTIKDDGAVVVNKGKIQCGVLTCPPEAVQCILRKRNNKLNPEIVDVYSRCVGDNGITILGTLEQFEAKNGEFYDTLITTGGVDGGSQIAITDNLDPKKEAEIIKEVNELTVNLAHEIKHTLNETMSLVNKQLKSLYGLLRNF